MWGPPEKLAEKDLERRRHEDDLNQKMKIKSLL